jgi:hypothetical protein
VVIDMTPWTLFGMRRLCVTVALAASVACGNSNPTQPSTPNIPQFGGNWTGTLQLQSCIPFNAPSASLCNSETVGTTGPFSLTLTQSGSVVSGPFTIGSIAFPSTGATISSTGVLTLQSSVTTTVGGATSTAQGDWTLSLSGASLSGTAAAIVSGGGSGVTVNYAILTSTRPGA